MMTDISDSLYKNEIQTIARTHIRQNFDPQPEVHHNLCSNQPKMSELDQ